MKLRQGVAVLIFSISLCVQPAFAVLKIVLTHGVDGSLPIAVSTFKGADKHTQLLNDIIQQDLTNSGRFRVKTADIALQNISYDSWRTKKIDNLITGSIKKIARNKYQVTVKLLDVLAYKHELLQREFTVTKDQLRPLAHRISDVIYEKLTGDKGVFSTRIAYVLVKRKAGQAPQYILEIADADGYDPKPLLISREPIMSPAWSPDGKRMAYVSFENTRSQIYIANVATGKRQLASRSPGINGAPSWSPDGSKLAIVLSKTGHPKIYVYDIKRKKLRQITHGWSIDTEPNWAPDAKSLIFTSDRGGSPQIYRVTLASGKLKRVTYQGNYNARASFAPDGQHIILLHRKRRLFNIAYYDLVRDQVQVLTKSNSDESPSLAPNGKLVLYATQDKGKGMLGIVSTDGRVQLRLPAREGNVQEPAWSPYLS